MSNGMGQIGQMGGLAAIVISLLAGLNTYQQDGDISELEQLLNDLNLTNGSFNLSDYTEIEDKLAIDLEVINVSYTCARQSTSMDSGNAPYRYIYMQGLENVDYVQNESQYCEWETYVFFDYYSESWTFYFVMSIYSNLTVNALITCEFDIEVEGIMHTEISYRDDPTYDGFTTHRISEALKINNGLHDYEISGNLLLQRTNTTKFTHPYWIYNRSIEIDVFGTNSDPEYSIDIQEMTMNH
jgi:hypothetical protein